MLQELSTEEKVILFDLLIKAVSGRAEESDLDNLLERVFKLVRQRRLELGQAKPVYPCPTTHKFWVELQKEYGSHE